MPVQKLVLFTLDASKQPGLRELDDEIPKLRELLDDGWEMANASVAGYGQAGSRVVVTVLLSHPLQAEDR